MSNISTKLQWAMSATMLAAAALIFFNTHQTVSSQQLTRQRTISLLNESLEPGPMEVSRLQVNGKAVSFDKAFQADDNFLAGLSFNVENKSKKPIRKVVFGLWMFKGTDVRVPEVVHNFPGRTLAATRKQEADVLLNPDEAMAVSVPKGDADYLRKLINESTPNLSRVSLSIEFIAFDDETVWRHGRLHHRDSQNLKRWIANRNLAGSWISTEPAPQNTNFSRGPSLADPVNYAGSGKKSCYPPWCSDYLGFEWKDCLEGYECVIFQDIIEPGCEGIGFQGKGTCRLSDGTACASAWFVGFQWGPGNCMS
jgi:hypothetical protein